MHKPYLVFRTVMTVLVVLVGVFSIIYGFSTGSVSDKISAALTLVAAALAGWAINMEYRY